ncbi:MAG: DUF1993 domain-containing protein [Sphingomonadaceae bacterium]|nr:DUF1993 domain-containing protein [Sphingomonadaceae bacterium]
MSNTQLIAPAYAQMLKALSGWLAKAQQEMPEAEALLSARLAPDMFPLSTQVRFACMQAQEAVYRLQDEAFPESLRDLHKEAVNAHERPGSIADAVARIDETVALLDSLAPDALDMDADSAIAHELPNGMILDLTAGQYVRDWSLGQFYFHLMIAYAILRHQGVPLGKVDYIPHMLPFIRPGSGPAAQ